MTVQLPDFDVGVKICPGKYKKSNQEYIYLDIYMKIMVSIMYSAVYISLCIVYYIGIYILYNIQYIQIQMFAFYLYTLYIFYILAYIYKLIYTYYILIYSHTHIQERGMMEIPYMSMLVHVIININHITNQLWYICHMILIYLQL